MKLKITVFPLLASALFMLGCSSGGGSKITAKLPEVSTSAATNLSTTTATLGGNITSTGGKPVSLAGVFVSKSANPASGSADFEFDWANSTDSGAFTCVATGLQSGTTYHVRAFAKNEIGISYGNEITFTLNALGQVTTLPPTDILTNDVTLKGTVTVSQGITAGLHGFVFSTYHNPERNSSSSTDLWNYTSGGNGNYSMTIEDASAALPPLQQNTVYYARAYAEVYDAGSSQPQTIYGDEVSFKTTGYYGPSNGYVFYDKGETSNGWRYMEAAPVDVNYYSNNITSWGCSGQIITQTYPDLGSGAANTARIISTCSDADCAARICSNYTTNNNHGWFLPSTNEAKFLVRALYSLGVIPTYSSYWTSSELNTGGATIVIVDGQGQITTQAESKSNYNNVRPVRRY
ncbi:hypothetical protein ACTHGU_01605 [Chitinophagaceae bacterium MMS25-I14]